MVSFMHFLLKKGGVRLVSRIPGYSGTSFPGLTAG